jgi:hypothetical protein
MTLFTPVLKTGPWHRPLSKGAATVKPNIVLDVVILLTVPTDERPVLLIRKASAVNLILPYCPWQMRYSVGYVRKPKLAPDACILVTQ